MRGRPRRTRPSRQPPDGLSLAWLAALTLAAVLVLVSAGARPLPGPTEGSPSPTGAASLQNSQPLGRVVEAELAGQVGEYAVAVSNLDTGESYFRNADRRFPSASLYKLGVLYETWRQMRLGRLTLETAVTVTAGDAVEPEPAGGLEEGEEVTVAEALQAMVTVSSNAAAHALMRTLSPPSVNASLATLGLSNTVVKLDGVRTGVYDAEGDEVSATSARDVSRLLTLLADGQLLGPSTSAEMRKLLLGAPRDTRIPLLLPPGTPVAHKTGELPGVRNDAAIVYAPRGTYVLVVLSRGVDEGDAMATIARLSCQVYDYFTGA